MDTGKKWNDFSIPDSLSSISIEVEDKLLYVHKEVLALWSPVFHLMFTTDFKEKKEQKVELPGKKVEDVIELLQCIYPPGKPVTDSNVDFLLPLVEEYQIEEIKKKCEAFLLTKKGSMELLLLAQLYGLQQLKTKCVEKVKLLKLSDMEKDPCFDKLDHETVNSILRQKVAASENEVSFHEPKKTASEREILSLKDQNKWNDFSIPDSLSSISIEVEDKLLHVHKEVLAMWSPVFHLMFTTDFKEKKEQKVELPGKKVEDVIALLQCIYPPGKPVTGSNVDFLLPLVEEYQIEEIKKKCEAFLLTKEGSVELLLLAQQYGLQQLKTKCVEKVKLLKFSDMEKDPCFDKLDHETVNSILRQKVAASENEVSFHKCKVADLEKKVILLEQKAAASAKEVYSLEQRATASENDNRPCEECLNKYHRKVQIAVNTFNKRVFRG